MTLTDEQVRALQGDAAVRVLWADTNNATIGDDPPAFALMKVRGEALYELTTEVLAQRERKCGTCKFWRKYAETNETIGDCHVAMVTGRAATWFCADWRAKETA